jgi:hypothetical protein
MDRLGDASLHRHAADNLRYIRDTMARAAGFTAVPGWAGILMGVTAIVTAAAAPPVSDPVRWLRVWMAEALVAVVIGLVGIARKARRSGQPIAGPAARRFALAFAPTVVAGAALTPVFVQHGMVSRLPGCWLLMYGAAVASAGSMSVPPVPVMGVAVLAFGAASFLLPAGWDRAVMAIGFGLSHMVCGAIIARRYGG